MLFLVALFLIKNTSIFKNTEIYQNIKTENGLTYNNGTIEDLVNRDTDRDGILDWEEGLWGTDPTKKETTPGIPDSTTINKLKAQQGGSAGILNEEDTSVGSEKLTQTEQFSRELFATVAAASQNGALDQATIDALGASLAEKIQNPVARKVFLLSDIKITANDNKEAVKNYINASNKIHTKYPAMNYTALSVLQKFIIDENNVDISVLTKLDPIIAQTNKIIDAMIKTEVPKSLLALHLNIINSMERLSENLSDIKLYDTDPIVSLGAISQYNQNTNTLESDIRNIQNTIQQKLNN